MPKVLNKIGLEGKTFVTDDWEAITASSLMTNSSPAKT
jgi:hypothetical protein